MVLPTVPTERPIQFIGIWTKSFRISGFDGGEKRRLGDHCHLNGDLLAIHEGLVSGFHLNQYAHNDLLS